MLAGHHRQTTTSRSTWPLIENAGDGVEAHLVEYAEGCIASVEEENRHRRRGSALR